MRTSGGNARLRVLIHDEVWREEVERLDPRSPARAAAERERSGLEREGLPLAGLEPCAALGGDDTRLAGLVKVYVPIGDGPPSERPFGFVLAAERDADGPYLELVAYGERHPARPKTRSVYQRAHKRLHGRYPGQ